MMQLRSKLLIILMLAALGAGACQQPAPEGETAGMPAPTSEAAPPAETTMPAEAPMAAAGPANYRVEFTPLWTKANFPFEYPDTSVLHKPHFSGLIGTAHNASYSIFKAGEMPTPGLERLSEQGKHDPLDAEIKAAIASTNALALTTTGPLRDFSQTLTAEVAVDEAHPMVSLVAMIAPSPDWFTGVADVNLLENGAWVASKTVDMNAWDSGGDDGTTYLAEDMDTSPKKPTGMAHSQHFMKDGAMAPVARITFTRM